MLGSYSAAFTSPWCPQWGHVPRQGDWTWTDVVSTMDGMAVKRRKPRGERKEEAVRVRVTAEEKDAWIAAERRDPRGGLSGWLRYVANQAARKSS